MPQVPNRRNLEKELAEKISRSMAGLPDKFLKDFQKYGWEWNTRVAIIATQLEADQRAIFEPFLQEIQKQTAQGLGKAGLAQGIPASIGIDWDQVNMDAANWARHYSTILAGQIADSSRDQVASSIRRSIADFYEDGLTHGELRKRLAQDPALAKLFTADVKDSLGRVYGPRRAEMIARTEVTRAAVEGERALVDQLVAKGANLEEIWHTRNDSIVCTICTPRNRKPINSNWNRDDGPPAHPNCRCWVGFRKPKTARGEKQPTIPEALPGADFGTNLGPEVRAQLQERQKVWAKKIEKVKMDEIEIYDIKKMRYDIWRSKNREYFKYRKEIGAIDDLDQLQRAQLKFLDDAREIANQRLQESIDEFNAIRLRLSGMQREAVDDMLERYIFVDDALKLEYEILTKSKGYKEAADEGIEYFEKLVSDFWARPGDVAEFKYTRKSRAFYRETENAVYMNGKYANPRTTVHELGHWLEDGSDEMRAWVEEFFEHRAGSEPIQKLSDITGHSGYRASEVAIKDKFIEPYMGKIYPQGGSEIISMGLELMYKDPVAFAAADPEMFDFIFNLVRGVKAW